MRRKKLKERQLAPIGSGFFNPRTGQIWTEAEKRREARTRRAEEAKKVREAERGELRKKCAKRLPKPFRPWWRQAEFW